MANAGSDDHTFLDESLQVQNFGQQNYGDIPPLNYNNIEQKSSSHPVQQHPGGNAGLPPFTNPSAGYQATNPQRSPGYQPNNPQRSPGYQPNNPQRSPGYQPNNPQRSPGYQPNNPQTSPGYRPNNPQLNPLNNPNVQPKFPPQNFDLPDISATNSLNPLDPNAVSAAGPRPNVFSLFTGGEREMTSQQNQGYSTIDQSQLSELSSGHLGFQPNFKERSPVASNSTGSPLRDSTSDSDDSLPLAQLAQLKRCLPQQPPPTSVVPVTRSTMTHGKVAAPKKTRAARKRKKKDPNEPQKPVSAYALFFRDTQAAIKGQNPSATFGEVSKIVASMWEGLDEENKSGYKKRTENAKKEYLKQIAAYRASQVSQVQAVVEEGHSCHSSDKSPTPSPAYSHHESPPHTVAQLSPRPEAPPPDHIPTMNGIDTQPPVISSHVTTRSAAPPPDVSHAPPTVYQPIAPRVSPDIEMTPGPALGPSKCVRNSCTNPSIDSPIWDQEYCSNQCVVDHCRDVFTAWVANRQTSNAYA